ncbi:hypothetical protein Hanom_Chr17g01533791 [Helianthus anomalus]
MESTSRVKMTRFQTFWIQMRKNKPLDESRKTGQTPGKNGILLNKKLPDYPLFRINCNNHLYDACMITL